MTRTLRLFFLLIFFANSLYATDSFHYFSAKADIEVISHGITESFTANLRYKAEDTLWISFTGTLGMEGMRMLITKDSTYVINKIEKSSFKFSNTIENTFLPLTLNLEDWKMILFNKMYTIDTSTLIVHQDDNASYTYYCTDYTKILLVSDENNIERATFQNSGLQCSVVFNNFKRLIGDKKIAYSRIIEIKTINETWKMRLVYENHSLNKAFTIPFEFAKYKNEKN